MKYTKEEVVKRITSELNMCLESANAEIYDYDKRILDVDLENHSITIKFDINIQEDDDYIGLSFY
jgi:hypothetical protein